MYIGEVSRRTGVSARMLRHYESLGLLAPAGRTSAGYREYGEEDLRRVLHIESLRSLGMSLQDVGDALADPGFDPQALLADLIGQTRRRLRRERELLARLRAVADSTPAAWEDVLRVIELLQGLRSPEPGRRQRAALDLGGAGESPAAALAASALREEEPNVAGALRWAVRQAGEEAAVAAARGLSAADTRVRQQAVRILGETDGHTEALTLALADDDAAVRALAALVLGSRGEKVAVPVLLAMVRTGDRDVDAAEALAIVARRDAGAGILPAVLRELDDPATPAPARIRLTQALAELPGEEARQALAGLRGDPEPGVRLTATAVLRPGGEIDRSPATPPLRRRDRGDDAGAPQP